MPGFEEWESFYVIVGAAAGALIGLQFVVMTLLAERPTARVRGGRGRVCQADDHSLQRCAAVVGTDPHPV